jgi:RalA-binding protein 1
LFLRELTEPILTNSLRLDFFQTLCKPFHLILDMSDVPEKIREMKRLMKLLPTVNYKCFNVILEHLHNLTQNSKVNKMNTRNVSIVFSPTLGIPCGVFQVFLENYKEIFGTERSSVSSSISGLSRASVLSALMITYKEREYNENDRNYVNEEGIQEAHEIMKELKEGLN